MGETERDTVENTNADDEFGVAGAFSVLVYSSNSELKLTRSCCLWFSVRIGKDVDNVSDKETGVLWLLDRVSPGSFSITEGFIVI